MCEALTPIFSDKRKRKCSTKKRWGFPHRGLENHCSEEIGDRKKSKGGEFWWAFCPGLKMIGNGLPEPGSYFYVLLVSYLVICDEMLANVSALDLLGGRRTDFGEANVLEQWVLRRDLREVGRWWLLWRGTKGCGCGLWGGRRTISAQDTLLTVEKRMLFNNMCNIIHSLGKCIRIS